MPSLLEREAERKARAGDALLARPVYLQAVADYRKDQGGAVYPDANGSLRITFGHVQPYTKLNGAKQLPFTTLEQIAAKTTGREPFDSPQVLVDAIEAKRYGGLADKRLGTVPVNFLADLDITGGNSGSPVMDRSEEHTSELQSLMRTSYAVFCLKKKTKQTATHVKTHNPNNINNK